jgi:hypothetical protein
MYCIAIHNVFKSFRAVAKLKTQLLFRLFMDYFWKKLYKPHNTASHIAYSSW